MRGAGAFGPFLRAGCAGAAWVRGGSLGSGMRAGRRCLAQRVGDVRWAGSLPATRTRVLVALAVTWRAGRRCVFQQCWVRHASAIGLSRGLGRRIHESVEDTKLSTNKQLTLSGAASGGYFGAFALVAVWGVPRLLHARRILCGKVSNNAYSQDSQEFGAPAGA